MKSLVFLLLTAFISLSNVQASPTNSGILQVRGDVMKPRYWTLAQIQGVAPVESIKTTFKGRPYTARGVRLWELVKLAEPKLDKTTKHSEARFVVLARGRDGYLASFALPELLPEAGNKAAFIVWEANGQPLNSKEGPLRLVVPGEQKPMRWVHNLIALEIYDARRLSQPSFSTATPKSQP